MRRPSFKIAAFFGALVPIVLGLSASAQDMLTYPQEIENRFAEVETYRLQGICELRDKRLSDLRSFLTPFLFASSKGFTKAGKEEYRTRLAEAAARPCPPRAAQPAPAPASVPAPAVAAPLPRTVTLEDLRLQLAEACGASFDPARERFIAALDRAIRLERNPELRRNLETDRAVVQRLKVPRCPSGISASPAPSSPRQVFDGLIDQLNDACGDSWSVLRLRALAALDAAITAETNGNERRNLIAGSAALTRPDPPPCETASSEEAFEDEGLLYWFVASTYLNRDLYDAEQARLAGNCALRAARIKSAKEALKLMQIMGDSMPSSLTYTARLAAQELRPCPDPDTPIAARPAAAAPPRRGVVMTGPGSLPPGPPTAPANPAASLSRPLVSAPNCSDVDRAKQPEQLTCRCLGQEQYLSTWGSNPYRSTSAICNAAIHSGVLPRNGMGMVRVIPVSRAQAALGTERNGISSSNWDYGFENAFTVAAGGPDPDDARPADPRWMSGTFDTAMGPMVLVNGRGSYGSNHGSIVPLRIAGPVLEAAWEESNTPISACSDGRIRGRVRFVFNSGGFTGLWAKCENALNSTWNGTRRKSR